MKKTEDKYNFDMILPKEVYDKQQEELRNKIIKNNKKIEKQQKISKIIIILIIATFISVLLYVNKNLQDKYMKSCQENGHSYDYCLYHS